MRALVLVFLCGCGARTGLDVLDAQALSDATTDAHDASADVAHDAPPDVVILPDATLECANGYFIEVIADDGGTTLIQTGCHGVTVPARDCVASGEDCQTTAIDGCGAISLVLAWDGCSCGPLDVGAVTGHTNFTNANGHFFGTNTIDVTNVGSAAAMGNYDTTIILSDGTQQHLHGAFCVRP